MKVYTVSFFGHREIEHIFDVEVRLEKVIRELIDRKEYVDFLVGKEGEFDQLVSSTIRRVARNYGNADSSLILVLPYMKAGYRNNAQSYHDYYDEVEVCAESSDAHFKRAIQMCNRSMVDRSDLVVCCIQRKSGGAYKTIQYARKQNCRIINIAEENATDCPNRKKE